MIMPRKGQVTKGLLGSSPASKYSRTSLWAFSSWAVCKGILKRENGPLRLVRRNGPSRSENGPLRSGNSPLGLWAAGRFSRLPNGLLSWWKATPLKRPTERSMKSEGISNKLMVCMRVAFHEKGWKSQKLRERGRQLRQLQTRSCPGCKPRVHQTTDIEIPDEMQETRDN